MESEVQGGRAALQDSMTKATQSLVSAGSSLATHTKTLQDNVSKMTTQQNVYVCQVQDFLSEFWPW